MVGSLVSSISSRYRFCRSNIATHPTVLKNHCDIIHGLMKLFKFKFHSFVGKLWCLCRMFYLPVAYLYGKRFVGQITPTVLALREEIYNTPYDKVDWSQARVSCA